MKNEKTISAIFAIILFFLVILIWTGAWIANSRIQENKGKLKEVESYGECTAFSNSVYKVSTGMEYCIITDQNGVKRHINFDTGNRWIEQGTKFRLTYSDGRIRIKE